MKERLLSDLERIQLPYVANVPDETLMRQIITWDEENAKNTTPTNFTKPKTKRKKKAQNGNRKK